MAFIVTCHWDSIYVICFLPTGIDGIEVYINLLASAVSDLHDTVGVSKISACIDFA